MPHTLTKAYVKDKCPCIMKSCFFLDACVPIPNNFISNCAENNDPRLPHSYKVPFHITSHADVLTGSSRNHSSPTFVGQERVTNPLRMSTWEATFHKERQNNTVTAKLEKIINYLMPFELVNATSASNIPYSNNKRKNALYIFTFSKTQLVVYYQCCVLIG